ncbi:VOC family protein [Nocardioides speluncae]|uniref:VOC family protein n=1 Tax=Nocardioides speluncae TaxID=2670337 RepID=UPI001F0C42E6|nr:VOC family protein [Nocardioides speluncae]
MIAPLWISAFLDLPASSFDAGRSFWCDVTGYELSPPRGERREFATLVPPNGDDYLRLQRVADGPGGIHFDIHVASPHEAADIAVSLGADKVADRGYLVMRSPGGFTFCLVSHPASVRPAPAAWDGHHSIVDQVCLDIPAAAYDAECAFWAALTDWEQTPSPVAPDFSRLNRPPGIPIRLLLQRLGERSGSVRAHLDLATDDRLSETLRHARLGAAVLAEHSRWTVLRDPVGATYCITDRDPFADRFDLG